MATRVDEAVVVDESLRVFVRKYIFQKRFRVTVLLIICQDMSNITGIIMGLSLPD